MHDLVDPDDTAGLNYLADAFSLALDDFGERRDLAPTLEDAAVVAGALGVMARLEPGDLDPVSLAGDEQEATARLLVARCAAYAPLFAQRAPLLTPWFTALAAAGTAVDSALGGDSPESLDEDWLGTFAPTVFRHPAARAYLASYFERALELVAKGGAVSGALFLCLRFRRWWKPSAAQRTMLRDHVRASTNTRLRPRMRAALRKLEPATPAA